MEIKTVEPSGYCAESEYKKEVLRRYTTGEDNAYEAYLPVYGEPKEGESDIDYVARCAEQDWDDAPWGGAIYQEVADEYQEIADALRQQKTEVK